MEGARLTVAVLMFLGASLHDLRSRRVPNRYWLPFILAAAIWLLQDALLGEVDGAYLAWAGGGSLTAYLFWRAGMFGGADAKALMVLAWLWPGTPDLERGFTPMLDTLVDATFVMLLVPVAFLLWNLVRGDLHMPAMLLGFTMAVDAAQRRHVWPLRQWTDGAWRWRYLHRPGGEADPTWQAMREQGITRTWVTPKIPFMISLTLGLVLAAWQGNLVLRAMAHVLS